MSSRLCCCLQLGGDWIVSRDFAGKDPAISVFSVSPWLIPPRQNRHHGDTENTEKNGPSFCDHEERQQHNSILALAGRARIERRHHQRLGACRRSKGLAPATQRFSEADRFVAAV